MGYRDKTELYKHVRNWGDLIMTNIEFLEGREPHTFYYGDTFHDSCYDDGMNRLKDDLVTLHDRYYMFTYDGQNNCYKADYRQRGYLDFACIPFSAKKVVERLLEYPLLYTFARFPDGECLYNTPDYLTLTDNNNVGELTFGKTNFTLDISKENNHILALSESLPNVHKLLSDTTEVFITFREFPTNAEHPEITTCLLDVLGKIHFN